MTSLTIKDLLSGAAETGSKVVVEGWIRTRRDSKAGLSFVQVHDGSCFDPIQVVAESSLENYQNEILHLTTHCAVRITGTLVESQGKGQRFEIQADNVTVTCAPSRPVDRSVATSVVRSDFLSSSGACRSTARSTAASAPTPTV